ncbi:MAG: aldehyde dehydrogenase family protein [Nitrospiria bacterium]
MNIKIDTTGHSDQKEIDTAVATVKEKAREFARLPVRNKAALLRECIPLLVKTAPIWVAEGCKAKRITMDQAGEEWLAGPMVTVRSMRLLAESLDAIATHGKPSLGTGSRLRSDGRLAIDLFPITLIDRIDFLGFRGQVLMAQGIDREDARRRQAAFYERRDPEGAVSLVLGAGNVSSIPPMDAFAKMFNDGNVCVLKINPVNEWVGPILERVLDPMIQRGYLRIIYGSGDVGKYLCEHPHIDNIHITGSDHTHNLIVWGPEGPERDRRMAEDNPLLKKSITSELGNVSPVAIVPYAYSENELAFQAQNIVSTVVNNASFNCNAAKILITAKGWPQRNQFLDLIRQHLAAAPTRKAYYPGAHERYAKLTGARDNVETFGDGSGDKLPWTLVPDVDSCNDGEPLFQVEPFCAILSETQVGSNDPQEFLNAATSFMNDRLWGTLNAMLVIHPTLEKDPAVAKALDRAIVDLRYGTVAINHWPAVSFALTPMPWGGHPSATIKNIQSGLGWVHNTLMLAEVEKSVLRGPLVVRPKPIWFHDKHKGPIFGPKVVKMEARPSLLKVPGVILSAL